MTAIPVTDLAGILPVDKPAGLTSHDVVARIRRLLGVKRVGHAGTLDPMATGLLVVLVGTATRLARFVEAGAKTYEARIVFGEATDTDDAEGAVIASAPVPAAAVDPAVVTEALAAIVGPSMQVPPAYAAIKIDGKKAYELARKGEAPEMAPRAVTIHEARLVAVDPGPPVTWDVSLDVSRGTYVRSIARDLGVALGTVAHLGALRRTAVGSLGIGTAVTLDALLEAGPDALDARWADPIAAMGLTRLALTADETAAVAHGASIAARPEAPAEAKAASVTDADLYALTDADRLLGVYRRDGDQLRPDVVLATPLHLGPGS